MILADKTAIGHWDHQREKLGWMAWICVALRASSATRFGVLVLRFISLSFSPSTLRRRVGRCRPAAPCPTLRLFRRHEKLAPMSLVHLDTTLAACCGCPAGGGGGGREEVATEKLDFLIVTLRGQQSAGCWAGKFWLEINWVRGGL